MEKYNRENEEYRLDPMTGERVLTDEELRLAMQVLEMSGIKGTEKPAAFDRTNTFCFSIL